MFHHFILLAFVGIQVFFATMPLSDVLAEYWTRKTPPPLDYLFPLFFFESKTSEFFFYLLGVCATLVAILGLTILHHRSRHAREEFQQRRFNWKHLLGGALSTALSIYLFKRHSSLSAGGGYLLTFFSIREFIFNRTLWNPFTLNGGSQVSRLGFKVSYLGALALMCGMFSPMLNARLLLMNEYLGLPTLLMVDGKLESDIDALSTDELVGFYPRQSTIRFLADPAFEVCERLPNAIDIDVVYDISLTSGFFVTYDGRTVCPTDMTSESDFASIAKKLRIAPVNAQKWFSRVRERNDALRIQISPARSKTQSLRELTQFEFTWKILNRWILHHHNFVYSVINEFRLGRPVQEIFSQYGLFPIVVLSPLMEATHLNGFDGYIRILFLFYVLYVFNLIWSLRNILKDDYLTLTAVFLAITSLHMLGFNMILLGPGANPIRHFLDITVVLGYFRYRQTKRLRFLALAAALSVIAVVVSEHFGLFVAVSLFAAVVFGWLFQGISRKELAVAVSMVAALVAFFRSGIAPGNELAGYFISGHLGFPIPTFGVVFLAAFVILSVTALYYYSWISEQNALFHTIVFFTIYSVALLSYYVRGGAIYFLYSLGAVVSALAVLHLKMLVSHFPFLDRQIQIRRACFSFSLVLMIASSPRYWREFLAWQSHFQQRETYSWSFPNLTATSTMDPIPFEDSVNLIQKYALQNQIMLISKFDAILPWLAGKYSGFRNGELGVSMIGRPDLHRQIRVLRETAPEYLFVDRDIEHHPGFDVIQHEHAWGYLKDESISRMKRLLLLHKIWSSVRDDYEKIESRGLLDVYKRKGYSGALHPHETELPRQTSPQENQEELQSIHGSHTASFSSSLQRRRALAISERWISYR